MLEQLPQPIPSPEINPERMIVVKRYLAQMPGRKNLETGDYIKVLEGAYAGKGMVVLEKKSNGIILAVENPQSDRAIELNESNVSHFADYDEAVRHALHDVPLTAQERPRPHQSDPRLRVAKREKQ